jgi:hypothetical protein
MLADVRNFLRLFEDATPAEERTPERLSELLDRLLIAYHESAEVAPQSHARPPSGNYEDDRRRMERCFPDFGLYGSSGPEIWPGGEVLVGDAIDDLADLYAELRGVDWLSINSGQADALWHFRFGYQSHWGRHLLDLRSYLHWKLYEPS